MVNKSKIAPAVAATLKLIMNPNASTSDTAQPDSSAAANNTAHLINTGLIDELDKMTAACHVMSNQTPLHTLKFGFGNVRTLRQPNEIDEFHGLHEYGQLFDRLDFDFVGLAESRIMGNDVCWSDEKYMYFFSGSTTKREHGVAIGLKTSLYQAGVVKSIHPINERIMCMCCSFGSTNITIIVAYAPIQHARNKEKTAEFYKTLRRIRTDPEIIPEEFRKHVIVMGDFNARVGGLFQNTPEDTQVAGILGEYITDKTSNSNGLQLINYCNEEELCIGNSFFESKRETGSFTCGSPIKGRNAEDVDRFVFSTTIDYILVSQSLKPILEWCQVHEEATPIGSADHLLIGATLNLHELIDGNYKQKIRRTNGRHRYNTEPLRHDVDLRSTMTDRLKQRVLAALALKPPEQLDMEEAQNIADELFNIRQLTCNELLPKGKQQHKQHIGWFEAHEVEASAMLQRKHELYAQYVRQQITKDEWREYRNNCTKRIKRMKENYLLNRANELVDIFESGDLRKYYVEINKTFGNHVSTYMKGCINYLPGIKLRDGKTSVSSPEAVLKRWQEHFSELFNQESVVKPNINEYLPSQQPEQKCDSPIMSIEISEALRKVEPAKAPGEDGISSDLELLCMSPEYCDSITRLFNACLKQGMVPNQLKHVVIIPLFKKGSKSICDNYRGISLINVLGKLFERVLLERIENIVNNSRINTDIQFGFTHKRSTTDGILTCRVIQAGCKKQGIPLYMGFVDLVKAYDRVHRPTLWTILRRIGISEKVVKLIEELNIGSMAKIHTLGGYSESFPLNNGVKQGSVLSPCLYNIFMGAIMTFVLTKYRSESLGVNVMYKSDAEIFSEVEIEQDDNTTEVRRIMAALFADDLVIFANSTGQLQRMMDIFVEVANAFGQKVSDSKTEVMASTFGHHNDQAPIIRIMLNQLGNSTQIKQVDKFKYLGSHLTQDGEMDTEIGVRQNKMWEAYRMYEETIFKSPFVPIWNKLLLFTTMVVPQATYGCGAWIYTPHQLFKLELSQLRLLGKFMPHEGIKFNMQIAMSIAHKHRWKSLVPISCRVHAMQVKYLANLIQNVTKGEHLHVICRCKIMNMESSRPNTLRVNTGERQIATQNQVAAENINALQFVSSINWYQDLVWKAVRKPYRQKWEQRWLYLNYYRQLIREYGEHAEMTIEHVRQIERQIIPSAYITSPTERLAYFDRMCADLNKNKYLVELSIRAVQRAWESQRASNLRRRALHITSTIITMYSDTISRLLEYMNLSKTLFDFRKRIRFEKMLANGVYIPLTETDDYPNWRVTLKDRFFTKQKLTMFVKQEGRAAFLKYWKNHQMETGGISRVIEWDSDDENGVDSDSDVESVNDMSIDESELSSCQTNIDITNAAKTIIGSKGLVIRYLKREYNIEATTIQQYGCTILQSTGRTPEETNLFASVIDEYCNDKQLLFRMLQYRQGIKIRLFIDVSNIACGLQLTELEDGLHRDFSTYLNTGALLEIARALRTLDRVVAVGSSPEQNNPFWKQFGEKAEIHVLSRMALEDGSTQEDGVDEVLHEEILRDVEFESPQNRVMVVMSGDGNVNGGRATNFPDVILKAIRKGWLVELWCWEHTCSKIYSDMATKFHEQFTLIFIDKHRKELVYQNTAESTTLGHQSSRTSIRHKRNRDNHRRQIYTDAVSKPFNQSEKPAIKENGSEEITQKSLTDIYEDCTKKRSRNRIKQIKNRKRKLNRLQMDQLNTNMNEEEEG